ncbi:MAG: biopolymer transporter ExbD, partial [Pseudomonadota bacterium]|nr:biopolymer transporter ExbD [Pseudomonadota bacterium]
TIDKFEIIPINPPLAQSGKPMDEGHILILLGSHGEVIIGDDLLSIADIQQRLAPDLKANSGKVITIKADAAVPANRVIEVMDAIKRAGGQNLSIVTQSKERMHVE